MVRYYAYYSNKSRGMRKKARTDDQLPALVESATSSMALRKNWARLIQKIYQVDPLLCPKCQGTMKVIGFIEHDALIKKILMHLGLWETRNHDPPQSNDSQTPTIETELTYDYTYSLAKKASSYPFNSGMHDLNRDACQIHREKADPHTCGQHYHYHPNTRPADQSDFTGNIRN